MSANASKMGDRKLIYHAYSIWLFTRSDLKTIVIPQTLFGLVTALAMYREEKDFVPWGRMLTRLPHVVLWVWINLLPFAINNQRQPAAILEDKHNKPWRTMPSGRMTGPQAKAVMVVSYPLAIALSFRLGGLRQCLALVVLGYGYNDLNLADWNWISRNAINALGFCSFASGALDVTVGKSLCGTMGRNMLPWLGIIAAVVFSTVQTQDMADQAGDRLRGRSSFPLSVGDHRARWMTALPVVAWSLICPRYWTIGYRQGPNVIICLVGMVIACRLLVFRSIEADKGTFRLWNIWMACLYVLPLCAAVGFRAD